MTKIETALQWALRTAADNSHGYSQSVRWGPSYDCSSFVITAFREAGIPLQSTYTGNMRADLLAHGFAAIAPGTPLQRGDVLLNEAAHTAIYLGGNQIVHAQSAEGTTDTADNSGREIRVQTYFDYPWDIILRLREDAAPETPQGAAEAQQGADSYTVRAGDTLWQIAERVLGSGAAYKTLMELNALSTADIRPGQVLKLPASAAPPAGTVSDSGELAFLETLMATLEARMAELRKRQG